MDNTNIYWAEGISKETAKGKFVRSPHSAQFFVRYPNNLYLTLVNTDEELVPYDPIKIAYWQEVVATNSIEKLKPLNPKFKIDYEPPKQASYGEAKIMILFIIIICILVLVCVLIAVALSCYHKLSDE